MRSTLLLLLFATGCEDFGKLQTDFCPAQVTHTTTDANNKTHSFSVQAALCDDFQTNPVDPATWSTTLVTTGATLEVLLYNELDAAVLDGNDPDKAYRGRGVLHAIAPPGGAAQLIETSKTPDLLTPGIRAFVYPGKGEVAGTTDLFSLFDGNGNALRKLSLVDGTPTLFDIPSGLSTAASGQLTPKAWNCINFFSRPTRMDVTLDNGVAGELPGLTPPPQAMATHIGPARGQDASSAPSEMWLDEVIIDSVLVGCGP